MYQTAWTSAINLYLKGALIFYLKGIFKSGFKVFHQFWGVFKLNSLNSCRTAIEAFWCIHSSINYLSCKIYPVTKPKPPLNQHLKWNIEVNSLYLVGYWTQVTKYCSSQTVICIMKSKCKCNICCNVSL